MATAVMQARFCDEREAPAADVAPHLQRPVRDHAKVARILAEVADGVVADAVCWPPDSLQDLLHVLLHQRNVAIRLFAIDALQFEVQLRGSGHVWDRSFQRKRALALLQHESWIQSPISLLLTMPQWTDGLRLP